MEDMNTIWIDVCLGTKEYSDEEDGGHAVTYIAKIRHKVELSKPHQMVSSGLDDDFKEITYQILATFKRIKKEMVFKEKFEVKEMQHCAS